MVQAGPLWLPRSLRSIFGQAHSHLVACMTVQVVPTVIAGWHWLLTGGPLFLFWAPLHSAVVTHRISMVGDLFPQELANQDSRLMALNWGQFFSPDPRDPREI